MFYCCEWLNHSLTPFRCVHNPERILHFRERGMRMFQPKIYLDNLWTILPDKMTNILETMKKFAEIKNPIIVLFIK